MYLANYKCSFHQKITYSTILDFMKKILLYFSLLVILSCNSTKQISKSDVRKAQQLYGLDIPDRYLNEVALYLERNKEGYDSLRNYSLDYGVMPAILFDPLPRGFVFPKSESCTYNPPNKVLERPSDSEIAFMTVAELSSLIRNQVITSEELTHIYIARIKKYDKTLKSVITLIEKEALEKAKQADKEIKNGTYRGPLHGIPYGVKDLVAVTKYPTTWGAMPYKDQVINETATIVKKLDDAGAILIAKLTSGALARGDVWWGGKTVSPWDTLVGASGSSAGSGSATAAGLVGFSIGTETLGSITSPSTRNGVSGLRPTYGRVSRTGVMPLSWSMDKVGPICRSAEDCALVFQTIQGIDEMDPTLYDVPFCHQPKMDLSSLKVGLLEGLFEQDSSQNMSIVEQALIPLQEMGLNMVQDSLPEDIPYRAFDVILRAEAGAFFDELVRSGDVDQMVQQDYRSRANSLRQSRYIPAVEYLQANRHRKVLIERIDDLFDNYDVIISPTFGGTQLLTTNLTGHPVVCVPVGWNEMGMPVSISFVGRLFEEDKILALAQAFQEATEFDAYDPPLFDGKGPYLDVTMIPGHAHNDYEQRKPLIQAMHNGMSSIEADVHLVNGQLYVSHGKPKIKSPSKTLEAMYLAPLQKHIELNKGKVHLSQEKPIILMIDVKTTATATFVAIENAIAKYPELNYKNGGPIRYVISGNRDIPRIIASKHGIGVDGRPSDLETAHTSEQIPMISQNYKKYSTWKGQGDMPSEDQEKIRKLVQIAHAQGKIVRLWASPDHVEVWNTLLDLGVDLINTDTQWEFRRYYLRKMANM